MERRSPVKTPLHHANRGLLNRTKMLQQHAALCSIIQVRKRRYIEHAFQLAVRLVDSTPALI